MKLYKKILTVMSMLVMAAALSGCGDRVSISPTEVGQVMGPSGYKGKIIPTSTFRLDPCLSICDKLVTLNVADQEVKETIELFMPKDKLNMSFDVRLVLAVNPEEYQTLFNKVPEVPTTSGGYAIPLNKAYSIYAKQVIRTVAREMMAEYSIAEVASNREVVGAKLVEKLITEVSQQTPFIVQYAGLADVKYPDIITKAQEKAAERREEIAEEEAITQKKLIALDREYQETVKQRKIDVEAAEAEAAVSRIQSKAMTPEYVQYKQLEIMLKMAESDNKVFMPHKMLDTIGGQVQLAK